MIRTASTPKAAPLPDLNFLTINSEQETHPPEYQAHPSLIRPRPRKPQPQPQPPAPTSPHQLQVPPSTSTPRQRKSNIKGQRRRAHSRVSDSGWLTDEIIGGQVDDFDFEGNLGKFDKRRDWEEFRVPPLLLGQRLMVENGQYGSKVVVGVS